MTEPIEIPQPQVLDPDRPLRKRGTQFTADDRPEAKLLHKALYESCDYAAHLWRTLDAMRGYLLASLPPDPRSPDADRSCARPAGPDDEAGWQAWIDAFASVSSVLCGPHGDSGFGLGRARQEAQRRRSAPLLYMAAEAAKPPRRVDPIAEQPAPTAADADTPYRTLPGRNARAINRAHLAVTMALGVLAIRRRTGHAI
ncbi:MAG TPA: hypothetical protein VE442_19935 [Jatrophihabitans sp.]|jgi:hypothetical protein|nr:hypothetical protein [Jatrophihabitans sp.]